VKAYRACSVLVGLDCWLTQLLAHPVSLPFRPAVAE
jgi:hypothetical protein